ncbi:hypothetical protein QDT91_28485 (plasmid) [Mycolicibacterium aubagnense]|uniref:hypothetical protein n=1 Tax=Mycolicibacterium aubagnense TaxID=319707 RepID=UPI0013F68149|nr:hypothetical protein [Mycolicibacterium aubagnense]WGI35947.1 hypothetical protein QDT91_28485 [Mycolicibacterium aubagnense]
MTEPRRTTGPLDALRLGALKPHLYADDAPLRIDIDEYSTTVEKLTTAANASDSPGDQELATTVRSILTEARTLRLQIPRPLDDRPRAENDHDAQPKWNLLNAPHKSAFPPPLEKAAAGGPRLNRRARRRAARQRGSSL